LIAQIVRGAVISSVINEQNAQRRVGDGGLRKTANGAFRCAPWKNTRLCRALSYRLDPCCGTAAVVFAKRAANIGGDAIAIYIAAKGHTQC
jgi:hypothetical protein